MGPDEAPPTGLLDTLRGPVDGVECILAPAQPPLETLAADLRQVQSKPGRGRQQNAGAMAASGRWFWFVHSDSQLPEDAITRVLEFIKGPPCIGYCRLRFADDGPWLTGLNALGANLRSRWLGLPYGDQGLCLPQSWFHRLGGFREHLARGEDLDLVVRAAKQGLTVRGMDLTLTTSARRYREHGWLMTTLKHQQQAWRLVRAARQP